MSMVVVVVASGGNEGHHNRHCDPDVVRDACLKPPAPRRSSRSSSARWLADLTNPQVLEPHQRLRASVSGLTNRISDVQPSSASNGSGHIKMVDALSCRASMPARGVSCGARCGPHSPSDGLSRGSNSGASSPHLHMPFVGASRRSRGGDLGSHASSCDGGSGMS